VYPEVLGNGFEGVIAGAVGGGHGGAAFGMALRVLCQRQGRRAPLGAEDLVEVGLCMRVTKAFWPWRQGQDRGMWQRKT